MRELLHPCVSCAEHIRVTETACPFCNATVPSDFAERARARAPSGARPLSRAAILFVGATAAAACGGSETTDTSDAAAATDGSGSKDGAAVDSGGLDGTAVLYGPAMVDSSAVDSAPDGPLAAYGPAPVDGGDGG